MILENWDGFDSTAEVWFDLANEKVIVKQNFPETQLQGCFFKVRFSLYHHLPLKEFEDEK